MLSDDENESEGENDSASGLLEGEREFFEAAPGREEELGDRLSAIG